MKIKQLTHKDIRALKNSRQKEEEHINVSKISLRKKCEIYY